MATGRVSITAKETGIDVISVAGRFRLGRVQRAEVGANLPNTPVQELGSDQYVGRIFDLPEVTATVNAFDVGPRTSFALAGLNADAVPSGTMIEAQDMRYVCLVQGYKANGKTNMDIARSLYVPGAKIERFSFNYSAGGDATEEYSFVATNRHWLKYDVAVASGALSGGALALSNARQLKSGRYALSVFASGIGYLAPEAILASSASGVVLDTAVVADGTPVVVAYHTDLSNQWEYTQNFPAIAPDAQPVGMRGFGVEVHLVRSGETSRILRAQTCTMQGQFPQQRVNELGTEEVVGYTEGIPDITGTLEIIQHDFLLQEQLSGDNAGAEDNFDPNELGSGDWGLLIKLYRRGVDRNVVGPEKTMWMPKLDVTQANDQTQVGQDSRATYNFTSRTGQLYIVKGTYNPYA